MAGRFSGREEDSRAGTGRFRESGLYRQKEVVIKNSITGEVVFRPPRALEVPWQVKELVEFINDEQDTHSILKAGIIHYELVRIHPFIDGNKRVALAACLVFM